MYRQVFSNGRKRITIDVPQNDCGRDELPSPEERARRISILMENNRNCSVSFKQIEYKFDRDEANNYDD